MEISTDLSDEISAIRAIYTPTTVSITSSLTSSTTEGHNLTLILPSHTLTISISIPFNYPASPPIILGCTSDVMTRGELAMVVCKVREVLESVWREGDVVLFDLIEKLSGELEEMAGSDGSTRAVGAREEEEVGGEKWIPQWNITPSISEKKSVFQARACKVSSISEITSILNLLQEDKKLAKATHNMYAYRIKSSTSSLTASSTAAPSTGTSKEGNKEIQYQDSSDDGETGAGAKILGVMQAMKVWNVMVVVTRWYGGIKLGPDRFRIIGRCTRDVLVDGGWVDGT